MLTIRQQAHIDVTSTKVSQPNKRKDVFASGFFDRFFFIYLHIKINAKFNKLIKPVGHPARFFEN